MTQLLEDKVNWGNQTAWREILIVLVSSYLFIRRIKILLRKKNPLLNPKLLGFRRTTSSTTSLINSRLQLWLVSGGRSQAQKADRFSRDPLNHNILLLRGSLSKHQVLNQSLPHCARGSWWSMCQARYGVHFRSNKYLIECLHHCIPPGKSTCQCYHQLGVLRSRWHFLQ